MLRGSRQRARLASRYRPEMRCAPAPSSNGRAALVCLRPLLFTTGGRYCVEFSGGVFSRHRALALALLVRGRVEARLFRAQVLAIVPSYVTRIPRRGALAAHRHV
jgi:hypothetical protein